MAALLQVPAVPDARNPSGPVRKAPGRSKEACTLGWPARTRRCQVSLVVKPPIGRNPLPELTTSLGFKLETGSVCGVATTGVFRLSRGFHHSSAAGRVACGRCTWAVIRQPKHNSHVRRSDWSHVPRLKPFTSNRSDPFNGARLGNDLQWAPCVSLTIFGPSGEVMNLVNPRQEPRHHPVTRDGRDSARGCVPAATTSSILGLDTRAWCRTWRGCGRAI